MSLFLTRYPIFVLSFVNNISCSYISNLFLFWTQLCSSEIAISDFDHSMRHNSKWHEHSRSHDYTENQAIFLNWGIPPLPYNPLLFWASTTDILSFSHNLLSFSKNSKINNFTLSQKLEYLVFLVWEMAILNHKFNYISMKF